MAKSDIERMYVTTSGQVMHEYGIGPFVMAFANLPVCANDAAAEAVGVAIGGLYILESTAALTRRPGGGLVPPI